MSVEVDPSRPLALLGLGVCPGVVVPPRLALVTDEDPALPIASSARLRA